MRTNSFDSEPRVRAASGPGPGLWLMAAVWVAGILAALSVARGMSRDGLTFLSKLAPFSGPIVAGLLGIALLLAIGSAYVLLKQERSVVPTGIVYRYPASARMTALAVLVLYVAAALVLVFGVLQFDVVNAGPVARGETAVAVAEFTPLEGSSELSALVARSLRQKIASLPDVAGSVTVISVPPIANDREARDFAQQKGIRLVIWGRVVDRGKAAFIPSITLVEPLDFQVWYGNVPAPREVQLTGEGGVELGQTLAGQTPALVEYSTGLIYLSRSNAKQAVAHLQMAIDEMEAEVGAEPSAGLEAGSTRTLAVFNLALARVLSGLGDTARARTEYQQSLKLDPKSGSAYVSLGNLDYRQHDCQAALSAYQQAVQVDPFLSVAWYSMGNAQFCLGRFDEAAKGYQQALQVAQPDSEARDLYALVRGVALCESGRMKEGMDQLSLAQSGSLVRAAKAEANNCLKMAVAPRTAVRTPALEPSPTPTVVSPSPLVKELLQLFLARVPTTTPTPAPSHTPTWPASPGMTRVATIAPPFVEPAPAATTTAPETPFPGPLPPAPTDVTPPTSAPPIPTDIPEPTSLPPAATPTAELSPLPTAVPPTPVPTLTPGPPPTAVPTTAVPTLAPSPMPTSAPPTPVPTLPPSPAPTAVLPTPVPTLAPTPVPAPTSAPPPTSAPAPTAVESPDPRPRPTRRPGPPPPPPTQPPEAPAPTQPPGLPPPPPNLPSGPPPPPTRPPR